MNKNNKNEDYTGIKEVIKNDIIFDPNTEPIILSPK